MVKNITLKKKSEGKILFFISIIWVQLYTNMDSDNFDKDPDQKDNKTDTTDPDLHFCDFR